MNWKQITFSLLILGAVSGWAPSQKPVEKASTLEAQPIAVVELFTSQGCSSCPAADKLLSELVHTHTNESRVFPLSFHVAYWDYLGWKDPFANNSFSDRQRTYAHVLNSSVYTPQMVFNGLTECVGSNKLRVKSHLEKALNTSPKNVIDLKVLKDKNQLKIDYKIEGSLTSRVLQIALVERMISIKVERGENGGRTLDHDNVVRSFRSLPLHKGPSGSYQVRLPENFNVAQGSIIAYVQNSHTLEILGASQANL